MKTLYVHIGTPKTGSSAIQQFCSTNRKKLGKKGYCYPKAEYIYSGYSKRRNGMFLQKTIYRDGERQIEEENQRFQEEMGRILHLFETYDNVILSDEGIWASSYEDRKTLWAELKEFADRNHFTVKVIVYLRRQDVYMDSRWKQRIKGNALKTSRVVVPWEEYVQNIPPAVQLDYYEALERISAALGKENVIARRYDRGSFPGGMIQADFLEQIGLTMTDEYKIVQDTVNESLSGNTCEIKRIVNTVPDISTKESLFFRHILLKYSRESEERYPTSMFSVQEAGDFVERYEDGNRKVAKEYLGEPDSELFGKDFKNVPKWEKDNPYMMEDVIRFVVETNIGVLRKMEEENRALREEIKELKRKLRHPIRTAVNMLGNAKK